jgi:hypothetical protein
MPTTAGTRRARTKRGSRVEIGVVALSTLVAVGVSVLFLALIGAGRSRSASRHHPSGPPAVSQYYGTRRATNSSSDPHHASPRAANFAPWPGNPRAGKEEK